MGGRDLTLQGLPEASSVGSNASTSDSHPARKQVVLVLDGVVSVVHKTMPCADEQQSKSQRQVADTPLESEPVSMAERTCRA